MNPNDLWLSSAWLGSGTLVQLTWALINFLWQGCAIAIVYAVFARAMRRAPANARYIGGVAALLAMAACLPATLWLLPPIKMPAPNRVAAFVASPSIAAFGNPPASISHESRSTVARSLIVAVATSPEPSAGNRTVAVLLKSSPYVAAIYLVGVLMMLSRIVVGLWSGRRLRGSCEPIADGPLVDALGRNARRLGMRVIPTVAYCGRIASPVVVGVLRPMILLPASLASGLTLSQLEAILLHELAHVRRFDLAVNVFQRLAEAMLFFHPAVWWVSRCVSLERENACDDIVLNLDHERVQYADALLRVAELCANRGIERTALAALAATGANVSQFRRRVLRLLGVAEQPSMRLSSFSVLTSTLLMASLLLSPIVWRNAANAESDSPTKSTANRETSSVAPKGDSPAAKEELQAQAFRLRYAGPRDSEKLIAPQPGDQGRTEVAKDSIANQRSGSAVAPPAGPAPSDEPWRHCTVHCDDLEVRRLLEMLSREAKISIVVSPGVTGNVTLDVKDRPIDDIMAIIARRCNLLVRRNPDMIVVSTRDEARKAEERNLPVRVYRFNYVKSSDVLRLVSPLMSKLGKIAASPDPKSRSANASGDSVGDDELIVFQDYEDVLKTVDRVIAQIDVPPLEIMIEAVLLQTKPGASRAAMDDTAKTLGKTENGIASSSPVNSDAKTPSRITVDHHGMEFGFIGHDDTEFIKSLESQGKTKVLCAPRFLVRNKQLAQIELGDPPTRQPADADQADSTKTASLQNGKLRLGFRPYASSDGMIRMEIHLPRSVTQQDEKNPAVSPAAVTTNVLIPDGQTIVICDFSLGTHTASDRNGASSPPTNKAASKELVLLVTSRIVKPTAISQPPNGDSPHAPPVEK